MSKLKKHFPVGAHVPGVKFYFIILGSVLDILLAVCYR